VAETEHIFEALFVIHWVASRLERKKIGAFNVNLEVVLRRAFRTQKILASQLSAFETKSKGECVGFEPEFFRKISRTQKRLISVEDSTRHNAT
jgi:hypothetical protein